MKADSSDTKTTSFREKIRGLVSEISVDVWGIESGAKRNLRDYLERRASEEARQVGRYSVRLYLQTTLHIGIYYDELMVSYLGIEDLLSIFNLPSFYRPHPAQVSAKLTGYIADIAVQHGQPAEDVIVCFSTPKSLYALIRPTGATHPLQIASLVRVFGG